MKSSRVLQFSKSSISALTRPWKKYRDGELFYGLSKVGNKRVALTTKQGNKTMYKGTGASGIGRHTKFGGYMINWKKVRTYVTPDIVNFELKPYVNANVPPLKHEFKGFSRGPLDPNLQLLKLKEYIISGKVQSQGAVDTSCYKERG
ncbi:hypothetical protein SKDZ_02G3870 [Saccharomyces kudriavzevii ZP591]|uniref:Mrpl27p n=1 Tax=Saccharomyces cerevisiae x Saccharomyces kudriavzevii (strain VIN7) TaxID=1095631 RepID=H0GRP6_SACCK|nr:Mrpl27p [Saccharomyces cerevisiae x Saccharomyces kudriavzevii VIN7]CAI4056086.1 hypothetical protein SKDZ_02G3870 [Saccharomyces kudriavzevii ZP591]